MEHLTGTKKLYAQDFRFSVINASISFKRTPTHAFKLTHNRKEDSFSFIDTVAKAFGLALTNFENANVRIKGLALESIYDTTGGLKKKLIEHCKDQLISSLPAMLGSVQFLGNPVDLFNSLGNGLVDFIEKPIEGFVQGPLEGGKGIIKGTESLLKNTLVGTVRTLNRVTISVADGISALAMVILPTFSFEQHHTYFTLHRMMIICRQERESDLSALKT